MTPAEPNADRGAPTSGPLTDRYGRVAHDLRISVTDRCNLRCTYCLPESGIDWLPKDSTLTLDETVRLATIAVQRLDITAIRFTGGEPLLRRDIGELVERIARLQPRPELALTTNGIGLAARAGELAAAGLDRVNVSLDTTDPAHFTAITRRDRIDDVLAGLEAAASAGLRPVKVNAVLDPQTGLDDLPALLRLCLRSDYELRVIEQMPLDAGHHWQRSAMVTAAQVLDRLRSDGVDLVADERPRGSAPAQRWRVRTAEGDAGTIGVIAAVTSPFCADCDRTRLTADGQLRSCLFARTETDLRTLLRGDAGDDQIEQAWRATMWAKAAGHGIDDVSFQQPDRPMSAIGG
ncbi:GTP 3',8-cyclase MoaA [Jongsikchunia kroppenstedtii]|uniref:GTP 3',8-cyclase MoaA n=1 Tax=Jongsikchunia kroppenstedtii TaxID=1121721 RepID=UPI000377DD73|nr:GTP 3',8-cyclase MoaA [Jongsikchunia kroppenstedtii]